MMRRSVLMLLLFCAAALAGLPAGMATQCAGVEPAERFLQALRERQYYDVALAYLDRLQTRPAAAKDFADTILYQYGTTLLAAARSERDPAARQQLLDRAQGKLQQFLSEHPQHELASDAGNQLATLLMQRASLRIAKAEKETRSAAKKTLYAEASQFFDRAEQLFQQRRETIRKRLLEMPKSIDPKKQPSLIEQREQLRAEYVHVQLITATIIYERAAMLKDDASKYRKQLEKAAEAYAGVAEKYRSRLPGLYAVLYRGRCYQDMGDCQRAVSIYQELLDEPDSSDGLRRLKAKALKRAMQCWLDSSIHQSDKAITQADQWLAEIRPDEQDDADWLEIRWLLGNTLHDKATASKMNVTEKNRLLAAARQQIREVSRHSGEHAQEAKQRLAQWHGTNPSRGASQPSAKPAPKTFAEANEAAREALEQVENATLLVQLVQSKAEQTKDAKRKKQLKQQITDAQQTIRTAGPEAIKLFRRALELASKDAPADQLNSIRFALCRLYYMDEAYYEAAVLGQFLAVRYPSAVGSRKAAQIAMASFYQLYTQGSAGNGAESTFATGHMITLADHIAEQWPEGGEAEQALALLVSLMVQRGDLEKAADYLEKLPADSRPRGEAELRTGQALWADYLRRVQQQSAEGGQIAGANRAELALRLARAEKMLSDGIKRVKPGPVDTLLLRATLSLAQIYLDTGRPAKAIALLQDPQTGPQTLLDRGDARVAGKQMAEAIYRATLRAAIATLPGADDPDAAMARAVAVMDKLKKDIGGTAEGNRRLIGIYVTLARDLQRQMQASPPAAKRSLSEGLTRFLTEVAEQSGELNVLYWVGETFSDLAAGDEDPSGKPTSAAMGLLEQAAAAYKKILDLSQAGRLKLDANTRVHVQRRLASTWRTLGNYPAAIDLLAAILSENAMRLDVQMEAAGTYQDWGMTGKSPYLERAVLGDRPDPKTRKNTIWGWARLANVAAGQMYRGPAQKKKYNDVFHQARLSIAAARYQQAMLETGNRRKEALRRAKLAITATYTLYPDMGGPTWRSKYDRLLKRIQKALGEKAGGLGRLEAAAS